MRKVWEIIKNVIIWAVVLVAVFMTVFTVVSVSTFDRNDRDLFGYKVYIVRTDSMAKTDFASGDLILVKEVADKSTLQVGDIITYISQNPNSFGEVVTHKIRALTVVEKDKPAFITYGTTNNKDDETPVTYPYILGKYERAIPKLGHFFNFLKSVPGYFLCIFLPFMLLIIYQAVNFFSLFRRYKKEQLDKLQAERDQIAAEREENAKMMAELQALKAQLEAQMGETQPKPEEEEKQ